MPDYQAWEFESRLLDLDTTSCVEYPEDCSFGYLYVLELSDNWINVLTWQPPEIIDLGTDPRQQ